MLEQVGGVEVVGQAGNGLEALGRHRAGSSPTSSSSTCRCRASTGFEVARRLDRDGEPPAP